MTGAAEGRTVGSDAETLAPILPPDIEACVAALLGRANEAGLRLASAESCTGGLLASLLTDVEGASHVFERGFIVYSAEAKTEMLGVPAALIARAGTVSRDVAVAMARGAIGRSRADLAIAVTGFAGPGGPEDEPGLVHFACAGRTGFLAHEEARFGDIGRGPTRIACLRKGLAMLLDAVAAQADSDPAIEGAATAP